MKNLLLAQLVILMQCVPGRAAAPLRSQQESPPLGQPLNAAIASQYFQEAQELCTQDNGKLWGISLCGPMLLVDPKTRALIANQSDKEGVLTNEGAVFVGKLPLSVTVANTAVEWAGVRWSMIIFPLPQDRHRRANLMAHELWHRIQNEIGFPSSGAANNHLESPDGRVWLQLEWRALAAALTNTRERPQAIADALLFRAYRRSLFPKAASEEREMEMHEGLAEYTGVRLCGSQDSNHYAVVNNVEDATLKPSFVRSFAYATGPAYGLLLDGTGEEWRKNLRKEDDLGILLQRRASIELPADIKEQAEARARSYDCERLRASETEREKKRQTLLAEYRARLVDGPVLAIPLQKMKMQFDPGNLLPLESLGTVYPAIQVIDVWGRLTVTKGALMNPTFSRIYVGAPASLSTFPLQGDGWTLELNDGWTVGTGDRKGDQVIKRLE